MNHTEKIVAVIVFIFLLGVLLIGVPVGLLLTNDSQGSGTQIPSSTVSTTVASTYSTLTRMIDFTTTDTTAKNDFMNVTMESNVVMASNVTVELNVSTEPSVPFMVDNMTTTSAGNVSESTTTNKNVTISSDKTTPITTKSNMTTQSTMTIEVYGPTEAVDSFIVDYVTTTTAINSSESTTTINSNNTTPAATTTTTRPGLVDSVIASLTTLICNIPILPFCP